MRAVLAVIGAIIILSLFGTMMVGIKAAQTTARTDNFAAVTTGMGVTEADVVLVTDPYEDDILNVTEITSDNGADAPLPDAYVTGSNTLTVRGLNANDTRDLIVTYAYGNLTGTAAAAGSFLGLMPLLIGAAAVIIVVGAMLVAFVNR